MLYIIVALKAEAKLFIENYDLIKSNDLIFPIYENDQTKLIISGIGSINSAIATTYLLTKYKISSSDRVLNIGMCGSKDKSHIGKLFTIDKIIDKTTNQVYHLKKSKNSLAISTYPKPLTDNSTLKTPLVDMESSGFYIACSKFIKKDNIMIKKIASDNLDKSIKTQDFIDELFDKHIKKIYEECISNGS